MSSRAPAFSSSSSQRCAELSNRMHDTEDADDDTTSVGEPDEGGGHDETASIDDGDHATDETALPPAASTARSVPRPTR